MVGEIMATVLTASRRASCGVRKIDGVLIGVLFGTGLTGEVFGVVRGVLRVVA